VPDDAAAPARQYPPGGHGEHVSALVALRKADRVPAGHGVGWLDPPGQKVPAGHPTGPEPSAGQ
jgi:hypothetical protein